MWDHEVPAPSYDVRQETERRPETEVGTSRPTSNTLTRQAPSPKGSGTLKLVPQ